MSVLPCVRCPLAWYTTVAENQEHEFTQENNAEQILNLDGDFVTRKTQAEPIYAASFRMAE